MASYNDDSFSRMQQEAIARVREMQRRAQGITQEQAPPSFQSSPPPTPSFAAPPPVQPASESSEKAGQTQLGGLLSSILGNVKIDEEKALIGMLIYVLYKNGGDVKLMLALGYLLL